MNSSENKITVGQYLLLKETLRKVPRAMRDAFIQLVCQQLGIIQEAVSQQISETMNQFFKELDAETN